MRTMDENIGHIHKKVGDTYLSRNYSNINIITTLFIVISSLEVMDLK